MVINALLRFKVVCKRSEESLVLITPFRWFRYNERVDYVASFLSAVMSVMFVAANKLSRRFTYFSRSVVDWKDTASHGFDFGSIAHDQGL